MTEFDIIPRKQKNVNAVASFNYFSSRDKAFIFLSSLTCNKCERNETIEFVPHILEHEMVEILTNRILLEDDIKPNPMGFDKLAFEWHLKKEAHICANGIEIIWTL